MKRFMELTVQFKFVWSLFFAAAMLLYTMIGMFLDEQSVDFITIWKIVVITILLTIIYYIFFSDLLLDSLVTKYKVILHFLCCYVILLVSVNMFGWIAFTKVQSLITFTIGYTLLYLSCMFSFYSYYKATGEELNDKLASYKEKRNIK